MKVDIKSFLIGIIFFLGFTFGKDYSLVGTWDCISCPESSQFKFILKKDNSGYLEVKSLSDTNSIVEIITWETVIDKEDDISQKGTFIYSYKSTGNIISADEYDFYVNPADSFKELFLELYPEKYKYGDVLMLTFSSGKFHMYERRAKLPSMDEIRKQLESSEESIEDVLN